MNFEQKVINRILNTIKTHQVYLTKPENLPQLAKLGYMYNTMWYSGRIAWGMKGTLLKNRKRTSYICEDNPKYKIEMCDPQTNEIESLIYDAWAMHVMAETDKSNWDEFKNTVLGSTYTRELDKNTLRKNKTFQDWINILMNKDYEYKSLFPSRKEVANHLLCCFGTGYIYRDGHIIQEAGGAGVDIAEYGDWKNARFDDNHYIKRVVNNIMKLPEVKKTINEGYRVHKKWNDKKNEDELKRDMSAFGMPFQEFLEKEREKEKNLPEKYHPYYPIAKGYSSVTKFTKKTHPSYIYAALRMCGDILSHQDVERPENIEFAEKFIARVEKYNYVNINAVFAFRGAVDKKEKTILPKEDFI